MEHNLFEEFQERKIKLKSLALKAKDYNWIDETRYNELIDKIDNDILTIGVIGQMKCGKSTFLNSFVFEDTILPAATTPMTAALSVITYGEEKKVVAEFYTNEETVDMDRLQALGVITGKEVTDKNKVEVLFNKLTVEFAKEETSKEIIIKIMQEYLPNFEHIETGKSLDSKM